MDKRKKASQINTSPKVCFAASSGGHLEQLLALRPLMERYDSFIVSEETSYDEGLPVRAYFVKQVNREERGFLLKMAAITARSVRIALQERPDVIVCTGVLATIPLCLACKALGAKLVYIESFAKTDSPTVSGRFLHRFADRFYVQWESMLSIYPDACFVGGVY